jgi:adenosylmethionine-8-amino-7-oxononanoate aminotransferase
MPPVVGSTSHIFPLDTGRSYPVVVRGARVWIEDADGRRYLDAMSGGSMAATLGYGRTDLIELARVQASRLAYVHNERLTNPPQEALAHELVGLAPKGFGHARFVTGGSEANEIAIQLARAYHVERGDHGRWQVISPAQAYHGSTLETLALTGRPGLHGSFAPYLAHHHHIPPSTWRFDPTGEQALAALDAIVDRIGPETISAYFCEPVSAAALPGYTPPDNFWWGLAERRDRYGFVVCFDEVVTGLGRTGEWFAGNVTPCAPDIIATAKGLGAGYAAIGAVLCREKIYQAVAQGSGTFTPGHTFDGAPVPCAVALGVIDVLKSEGWVERVRERGPSLRQELADALAGMPMVKEVRGRGYLVGVEFVDPRDGSSFLPPEMRAAHRIDEAALELGLVTLSTQGTRDGFAGDQTLFAPAFVATDEELADMVGRFADAVRIVANFIDKELMSSGYRAISGGPAG